MPYLIDGHNLIAQLPDIDLSDPQDEMKLVNKLKSFSARTKKRCVVIFDKGATAGRSPHSSHLVEVNFAGMNKTADDVLMLRIKTLTDPKGWTLVTSDQAIIQYALGYKVRCVRSADFIKIMDMPKNIYDLGEWAHVYIKPTEVDEYMRVFTQSKTPTDKPNASGSKPQSPTPTTPPKSASSVQSASYQPPVLGDEADGDYLSGRTLPKPKPKPPKPPMPKPPRRDGASADDKPTPRNDVRYWMDVFGLDDE